MNKIYIFFVSMHICLLFSSDGKPPGKSLTIKYEDHGKELAAFSVGRDGFVFNPKDPESRRRALVRANAWLAVKEDERAGQNSVGSKMKNWLSKVLRGEF